jgi:hypothetical protein
MTPEQIADIILSSASQVSQSVGLRVLHPGESDGLTDSWVWDDGVRTGVRLAGTCALVVSACLDSADRAGLIEAARSALSLASVYSHGATIAVIEGGQSTWGEDEAEIVIPGATILTTWSIY